MSLSDDRPGTAPVRLGITLGIAVTRAFRGVADTIIPPVCLACSQPISDHDALCAACWRGVAFIRPPLCDRLGLPMPFGGGSAGGPLISAAAAASPPDYDRARAVAVFNADTDDGEGSVLRDLVHGLKYADRMEARRLLGR